jgi:phenylpyruvate tautomerase PptA (4-oxalocrotonate tautomerase family)
MRVIRLPIVAIVFVEIKMRNWRVGGKFEDALNGS